MSESKNLTKQVEKINVELRGYGRVAVQEVKMMKDGKVIGQVRYGYKLQYFFDAVNGILHPKNWFPLRQISSWATNCDAVP